jgi:YcxB-like protein
VTTTTADTPITFETQANQSEFAEARQVATAARTVTRIRDGDLWLAIRLLMRPLFGALLFGAFSLKVQTSPSFPVWAWMIVGAVAGLLPSRWTLIRQGKVIRRAEQASATNGPSRYAVSNDGIREINPPRDYATSLSGIGVGEEDGSRLLPWSAFLGYRETQRLIVLLYKEKASLVIAKRCLSSIDAADLMSILSQNLRRV